MRTSHILVIALLLITAQAFAKKPVKPPSVTKVYADNIFLGDAVAGSGDYNNTVDLFLYNSGYFFWLNRQKAEGIMTLSLDQRDFEYQSFDCTGQAYAPLGLISDTQNVLIGNGDLMYKSLGAYSGDRPVVLNSVRVAETGICFQATGSAQVNYSGALVEAIDNPLPYELPMEVTAVALRLEYSAP